MLETTWSELRPAFLEKCKCQIEIEVEVGQVGKRTQSRFRVVMTSWYRWMEVWAVFPNIEVRHLRAVVILAEELNFTRAARSLHISQPCTTAKRSPRSKNSTD